MIPIVYEGESEILKLNRNSIVPRIDIRVIYNQLRGVNPTMEPMEGVDDISYRFQ